MAWVVARHGAPDEVLEWRHDVVLPEPAGRQVVIAVGACALNFADDLLCRGSYQEHPPLPFTPGLEVAGTVVAAGPESSHPVGTRVVGSPLLPHGGLAERCLALDHDVFPIPAHLDDVTAAAMHVTYQTGWFALHRRAHVRAGETLLVHAGAGGAGSAAIQLAKAAGLRVLATAGGAEKVARCRELGADAAFDYRRGEVAAWVLEQTDGQGADVVFDPVGGDTFLASTRCIAWEGRILVVGAASGVYAEARTNHVLVKNYAVVGVHWGGYRTRRPELLAIAHQELMRLSEQGAITPLVTAVAPLDEVPVLLGRLTSGRSTGKLVLTP